MSQDNQLKIEPVSRAVIEEKLLVALDDASKVAILAREDELLMLIRGLDAKINTTTGWDPAVLRFRADMHSLGQAAFGWTVLPPE